MTGLWLASYLVLWVLVVVICLLLIGMLHQIGLLYRRLESSSAPPQEGGSIPSLENDGPAIGSQIVELDQETINGFGALALTKSDRGSSTLLVFMSPMCETCQHIVEPLNALVADDSHTVHPIVIMRADEHACRSFLSVFPLHMPVVCDCDRTITMGLDVHRTPFGLLYDEQSILIRKGVLEGQEDLMALLGDESAPGYAQANVYPPFVPSQV